MDEIGVILLKKIFDKVICQEFDWKNMWSLGLHLMHDVLLEMVSIICRNNMRYLLRTESDCKSVKGADGQE